MLSSWIETNYFIVFLHLIDVGVVDDFVDEITLVSSFTFGVFGVAGDLAKYLNRVLPPATGVLGRLFRFDIVPGCTNVF